MVLPTLTLADVQRQVHHAWDNKQDGLMASISISYVIAFMTVLVRLWARRIRGVSLSWNDYFIVFSLVRSDICQKPTYFLTIMQVVTTAICAVIYRGIYGSITLTFATDTRQR